jgi:hypothetical protein
MGKKIGGIAGIFEHEKTVLAAASKCREMGLTHFDAVTPYPVHGMEEAIGIKRSVLPWATFIGGLCGMAFGLWFTIWTSAYNWPINVGGKPMISLPAFIPIVFELTILFAALSSVCAFAWFCKVPRIDPPVIDPTLTSHRFAVYIAENEVGYDAVKYEKLFKDLGAVEVKKVSEL